MNSMKCFALTFLMCVAKVVLGYAQMNATVETKGIYGHPKPLWERGYDLNSLGVNAVFLHSGSIDSVLMRRAEEEGLKVYAEFATLNGKGYVDQHPEAHAINQFGHKVKAASWFMGVCPSNEAFQNYRFQQLRDLLTRYQVDGVWMDYVHWHAQFEEPDPILPETCFCEDCLTAFSAQTGAEIRGSSIPEKANWILENVDSSWRSWRCQVIADWSKKIKYIIDEERPGALLGLYHCPWTDDEFGHARRRILGLDYDLLVEIFDVFSPMVYHARMGRPAQWVETNIHWHSDRLHRTDRSQPGIWAIVQAYDDPYSISAEEFETVLKGGIVGRASGVMMFTTRALAEHPEKIKVMQRLYQRWDD